MALCEKLFSLDSFWSELREIKYFLINTIHYPFIYFGTLSVKNISWKGKVRCSGRGRKIWLLVANWQKLPPTSNLLNEASFNHSQWARGCALIALIAKCLGLLRPRLICFIDAHFQVFFTFPIFQFLQFWLTILFLPGKQLEESVNMAFYFFVSFNTFWQIFR